MPTVDRARPFRPHRSTLAPAMWSFRLKLQVTLAFVLAVIVLQSPLDIHGMRVVSLDEITVVDTVYIKDIKIGSVYETFPVSARKSAERQTPRKPIHTNIRSPWKKRPSGSYLARFGPVPDPETYSVLSSAGIVTAASGAAGICGKRTKRSSQFTIAQRDAIQREVVALPYDHDARHVLREILDLGLFGQISPGDIRSQQGRPAVPVNRAIPMMPLPGAWLRQPAGTACTRARARSPRRNFPASNRSCADRVRRTAPRWRRSAV